MPSNAIIQYSSSSSSHMKTSYEVFVSVRGDIRNNFAGHLFGALSRKAIHFFKDDTKLEKGKLILPELLKAIEGSQVLVVVFSKEYASSTWCLRELVKISDYIEVSGKHVLPIFYDVTPAEVRYQIGNYKSVFDKYEERFKEDNEKMEEVLTWRNALSQVANLCGWDIGNMPQDAEIEKIVQDIKEKLCQDISNHLNGYVVGIESRIQELEKLLLLDLHDVVQVIGICGMPAIGKTTLVTALYERIYHQYNLRCFIDDVSKSFRDSGTLGTQELLLRQALNEKKLEIDNNFEGTRLLRNGLSHAKALVVLDNVDDIDQLYKLGLNRTYLGAGSRIIIISSDKHILEAYGVDHVYHVQHLNEYYADQLLCKYAFRDNYIMSDYEKLKYEVLSYVQGHPFAIKVLGSLLFGRDIVQWESALARLKESPNKSIMDVLRISFDGLDKTEKEIFLDLACLNLKFEEYASEVLHFRGFHPEIGLKVLVDKSLISIENGRIRMNSLLVDLGRNIVRENSPKEPRKWSRLWDVQDLRKVMSDNMEAENLEAIDVQNFFGDFTETTMRADALSKMRHLKFLILHNVNFSGSLNYLSNEIGYLTWNQYPFECLPPSFQPEKLVELLMVYSKMKHLWKGTKPLHNLRDLILYGCENLIEMPDLGEALNLEVLNLKGCIQLKQLHPSIGLLRKLSKLNLQDCKSLIKLPRFGEGLNLELLNLEGCIQLRQIEPSIGLLRKLAVLNLKDCKNLESLPTNILGLNSLEYLSLSGCTKLYNYQLLDEPRDAKHLKMLCVGEAPIHSQSIFSNMKRLLQPLDWLPTWLFSGAHNDSVIYLLPSSPSFPCIRELDLSFCNLLQIPDAIGNLHCLERLILRGNNFDRLPSLRELSKLYCLYLTHCKQFKDLIELPLQTDLPSKFFKEPKEIEGLDDRTIAGLCIINCPELVEKERCIRMTISWMMQFVQATSRANVSHLRIKSVIPGSEIPRWFQNQREGNSIRIDTPPDKHDNNLIGIASCAVFSGCYERGSVSMPDSLERVSNNFFCTPWFHDEDLVVTNESDHMCLFYYSVQTLRENKYGYGLQFVDGYRNFLAHGNAEFGCRVTNRKYIPFEVKKCGYRWVYEQDQQLPDVAVIHRENLSNRKCKLLEIEEKL